MNGGYLTGSNAALFTDLYELTMAQAYLAEGMCQPATFSLFYRTLPDDRNYLLSCGVEDVVDFAGDWRFSEEDVEFLTQTGRFSSAFLHYLEGFRFTGDIHAVPDGTAVFPEEPLLEVTAPMPEAQLIETWAINQMHAQSVLATKAARVVTAAGGRPVLDFGLRRIHGAEGGVKAARAFHVAGVAATSNVLAGRVYGLPLAGTMAHSYVQAHDSEMNAFRAFARAFPQTVLLVDTYDTLEGVRNVVRLARELGDGFRVGGVRLDSGDLAELSRRSRQVLDEAGLTGVQIFVSGGLDEHQVASLVEQGCPIDGFGVGTAMGVSEDAPALDMAYKLVAYAGQGRSKLSAGKPSLPGEKQIFRRFSGGTAIGDVLGRRGETTPGTPLLEPFMAGGRRVRTRESPDHARERTRTTLAALPDPIRAITRARERYPVRLSEALSRHRDEVRERLAAAAAAT